MTFGRQIKGLGTKDISSMNYKINSLIININSMNYINTFNIVLKLLINN